MIKTRQELIENPGDVHHPHIVLLGAGASRAAFPKGDAAGKSLPVMDDLIDVVGLKRLMETGAEDIKDRNFEAVYGRLASDPSSVYKKQEIERRIDSYFTALSLPNHATIYDRLLVSLRPADAVFTFNWDPFLFDAYQRNRGVVPLPEIFFLHGNVRIGACVEHDKWGARKGECPECFQPLADVPLLYPIEQKDYSSNPYIQRNWHAAQILFRDAFTLTIFGYGAPTSDKDAVELLRSAWTGRTNRTFEHIEIIDIAQPSSLHNKWSTFAPTHHYRVTSTFEQSRLARWPRRSCESLVYLMKQGAPCEDFPLPTTDSLSELQAFAAEIAQHEKKPY